MQWIDWKKKETERVAELYKDEKAFLSTKPKASYFKGILHIKKGRGRTPYETKDPFGKSTQGTYSKPYQILKKNTNKRTLTQVSFRMLTPSSYNQRGYSQVDAL